MIYPRLILSWLSITLIFSISLSAQDSTDYFNATFLRYANHIYKSEIKTVLLSRKGFPLSDPVIQLNTDEKLVLTFDDLTPEVNDYSYRWIHCSSNWEPSTLLSESDYIDGFFTDHIVNYRHSFNTLEGYFHYNLEFPNAQMRPMISGNYLLVIYLNEKPDEPIITERFWVVDSKVEIQSFIHRASDIALRNTHQEIDFKLQLNTLKVANPYSDIKVTIVQNNRWDAAITNLKPVFALDGLLDYNYEEGNLFNAGNEFRNFDLRTTRFQTQYVSQILQDSVTHHYTYILKPDLRRSTQRYTTEDDINGRYLIKIYDDRDGDLEGDYVNVNFRLPVLEESDSGSFYIFGQLTNWSLEPWAKMKYNEETRNFEQTITVKQGYYNYEYLFKPMIKSPSEIAETEGSHYETENDYAFFVYYRDISARYDHLVGYRIINSRSH